VWSYAHLPLYVGIAVVFAGIERIVHDGAVGVLNRVEGVVLGGALALTMLALLLIGRSRTHSLPPRRQRLAQVGMAVVAVMVGVSASRLPAVLVVIALAMLCLMQLTVALSDRRAPSRNSRFDTAGPAQLHSAAQSARETQSVLSATVEPG